MRTVNYLNKYVVFDHGQMLFMEQYQLNEMNKFPNITERMFRQLYQTWSTSIDSTQCRINGFTKKVKDDTFGPGSDDETISSLYKELGELDLEERIKLNSSINAGKIICYTTNAKMDQQW